MNSSQYMMYMFCESSTAASHQSAQQLNLRAVAEQQHQNEQGEGRNKRGQRGHSCGSRVHTLLTQRPSMRMSMMWMTYRTAIMMTLRAATAACDSRTDV
jgi:hypothetical protein